ncbi:hypothetical protein X975_18287, partial [Stegodyphus mimosarum]
MGGCFGTQQSRPSSGIESLDGTSLHQTRHAFTYVCVRDKCLDVGQ